jgi:predicted glycogen debranching enzyme
MSKELNRKAEWLEADGLGGFSSGTVSGIRTRRYHALLLVAATPPSGRYVLVNGLETWVETPSGIYPLSSHAYAPGTIHPDGAARLVSFEVSPWPHWEFRLEDGTLIEQEIFVPRDAPLVVISWKCKPGRGKVTLATRPLISGRDPHALHHENPAFRFASDIQEDGAIRWQPYDGVPAIRAMGNGAFEPSPEWYRSFLYSEERDRGFEFTEDLASPGIFRWDFSAGEAFLLLGAEGADLEAALRGPASVSLARLRSTERRRRARFPTPLHRAADAYLVRRGAGRTIVAGYPWFGDWGRDTFIALRGLCLATGRIEEAGRILIEWTEAVSEGMLPNRFPDRGESPEYNSVDASLWFVIAVHDYLEAMARARRKVAPHDLAALRGAVEAILEGYAAGTRYGIRCDEDGLLAAGVPGVQLTWMDAKIGDWVVTPRIGKPVEVEALWLNALRIAGGWTPRWADTLARGERSFTEKFWNEAGFLVDVVDVDHVPGRRDATLRPNQIFAAGGLPYSLLTGDKAARVVRTAEERLLTPFGLRTLAPEDPGYRPRYEGGAHERDSAYHQGTVWPWLMGAFVDAWVRSHGATPEAKQEARRRFLDPLLARVTEAGLGHLAEIADAEPPHSARGCPFQAWSVGEALRIAQQFLKEEKTSAGRSAGSRRARPARAASTARELA